MFPFRHRGLPHVRCRSRVADPGTAPPAAAGVSPSPRSNRRRPVPRRFDSARLQGRRFARSPAHATAGLKAFAPWSRLERPDFAIPSAGGAQQ